MRLHAKGGSEINIPIGVARRTPVRPILLRAADAVAYFCPRRRDVVILTATALLLALGGPPYMNDFHVPGRASRL